MPMLMLLVCLLLHLGTPRWVLSVVCTHWPSKQACSCARSAAVLIHQTCQRHQQG